MWPELLPYLTPGGVALSVAIMVYTDRLVPYRSHMRQLAAKQQQIDKLEAALTKVEGQRDRLLGLAEVTVGVMQALPKAAANKDSVS